jgi:CMP-N-acetylneuraminic acid synthetase
LARKNVRDLCGKPLIAYTIEAALDSEVFDQTIVSTEDEEIARVASDYGATVPFTRPQELATDTAQVVDVLDHVLEFYDERDESFAEMGVVFPTAPLRTAADIDQAYQRFRGDDEADFLMSVTEYQHSPVQALTVEDGYLESYWDNGEVLERRSQDQPDLLVSNGAIYFLRTAAYREQRTFYGDPLIGYRMPPERSVDIDEEFDLKFAQFLLERS